MPKYRPRVASPVESLRYHRGARTGARHYFMNNAMICHCFTYGSLMCEDIMASVAGPVSRGVPAQLPDYARHPLRGEEYPGIRASPGVTVAGVLYRDLPDLAWPRLDAFEGEMYERRAVPVFLEAGERVEAWAYIVKPASHHLLLPGEWDFDAFLAHGKARFTARYLGFDRIP